MLVRRVLNSLKEVSTYGHGLSSNICFSTKETNTSHVTFGPNVDPEKETHVSGNDTPSVIINNSIKEHYEHVNTGVSLNHNSLSVKPNFEPMVDSTMKPVSYVSATTFETKKIKLKFHTLEAENKC